MTKVTDATFFLGKATGGMIESKVIKNGNEWAVLELLNDDDKVYWRLWTLWNDFTTRDYYTDQYKQDLSSNPKIPIGTRAAKPF